MLLFKEVLENLGDGAGGKNVIRHLNLRAKSSSGCHSVSLFTSCPPKLNSSCLMLCYLLMCLIVCFETKLFPLLFMLLILSVTNASW